MKLKRGFRGIVIALVLILCTNAAEEKVPSLDELLAGAIQLGSSGSLSSSSSYSYSYSPGNFEDEDE